jgi:hypothetical protein
MRLKFYGFIALFVLGGLGYVIFSIEAVQKKVFDIKADLIGSHRTITFYNQINAQPVASFTDKDVRFEETNNGISVWLGQQQKKVHSNMFYIIEDK